MLMPPHNTHMRAWEAEGTRPRFFPQNVLFQVKTIENVPLQLHD